MKALLLATLLLCSGLHAQLNADLTQDQVSNSLINTQFLPSGNFQFATVSEPTVAAQASADVQVIQSQSTTEVNTTASIQSTTEANITASAQSEASITDLPPSILQNTPLLSATNTGTGDVDIDGVLDILRKENDDLKNQLDVVKADLAKVNDDLNLIYGVNANLTNSLFLAESLIIQLKTQLTAQHETVVSLSAQVVDLNSTVYQVNQHNSDLQQTVQDTNIKLQVATQNITNLSSQISDQQDTIESCNGDKAAYGAQVSALQSQYSSLKDRNDQAQEDLANSQETVANLTTVNAQLNDERTSYINTNNDLTSRLTTCQSYIQTVNDKGEITSPIDELATCRSNLQAANTQISNYNDQISQLNATYTTVVSSRNSYQAQASQLQINIAQVTVNIAQVNADNTRLQSDKNALLVSNGKLNQQLNSTSTSLAACISDKQSYGAKLTAVGTLLNICNITAQQDKDNLQAKYKVCMQDLNYQYSYLAEQVNSLIGNSTANGVAALSFQPPANATAPINATVLGNATVDTSTDASN